MRAVLVLRGLIGVLFGLRFLANAPADWSGLFSLLSGYLIIDGCVGLLIAGAFSRASTGQLKPHLRQLAGALFFDSLGRIASGVSLQVWPGIPGFPVTAVIFIALMAVFTAVVGVSEAMLVVQEEITRHGRQHARPQFAVSPVLFSSAASVSFGIAALWFAGDMALMRPLLAAYVVAAGSVMFAMAWTRHRSSTRAGGMTPPPVDATVVPRLP